MFLFNLSLLEFMALFAGVSGIVSALYLLDRTRHKHRVATLRFWTHSDAPSEMQHRRKIQQPWSLLLQILSLLCLLLALAQLRWGSPFQRTRDHVLILDTSAIMNARVPQGRLMDQSRVAAKAWLKAVPKGDRVMLVRADTLSTAATAFESNLAVVDEAISLTQPAAGSLRMGDALRFAKQAQQVQDHRAGEIVYAGAGRIGDEDDGFANSVTNLRVLPVKGTVENVGLRKIGLRRSPNDEKVWEVYGTVRNDGARLRLVPVVVLFGGGLVGQRQLTIAPNSEQSFALDLRTQAAGLLETRIQVNDNFPDDDRAVIEIPTQNAVKVAVYSNEPELLKPVFSGHPRFDTSYRPTAEYSPTTDAAVVVLDRFAAAPPTKAAAIWINPPRNGTPIAVTATKQGATLTRWRNDNAIGAGLHTRDIKLDEVSLFTTKPEDLVIAEVSGGAAALARPSARLVALGFHPMRSALKFELATPLLFANILRWLSPEVFLRWELNAGSAGGQTLTLDSVPAPGTVKVTMDGGRAVPFTIEGQTLRFFSGAPGVVRVNDGKQEHVYSLTLPDVASGTWKAPPKAVTGVPVALESSPVARDLWQWLALLGGAGLIAEWILFGRARRLFRAGNRPVAPALRKAS
ncbi:MAG: VWA domain-containing protein [Acidobacteria bacterium]|nr:VWA domain-containing protein [Acidobacteriota bacterium]